MDVTYITVKASKLSTVPKVDGQIIAISDKDALFYDMEGERRPVSGQKVVNKLPADTSAIYRDTLYIVVEGNNQGVYLWNGLEFIPIAGVNTDENVKTEVSGTGKMYITGSEESADSTGTLKKHKSVYIDSKTGTIFAEQFSGGVADKARSAEQATTAESATYDSNKQNITQTYIKSIEARGTAVTVTYGNNTTKVFNTQDTNTHRQTNMIVGPSSDSQENGVATNGNVHINIADDNLRRSSHVIKGEGSVKVTSDGSGNISIQGTDTWRPNTASQSGYVAPGEPDKVWATDGDGNPSWRKLESDYEHPQSGVAPGTYTKVTVNSQGHVLSGENPQSLSGYNIKDGVPFKILPNDADLDEQWDIGFYIGERGNSIKNKPKGVDGFSVLVTSTPDPICGVQRLFDGIGQHTRYIYAGLLSKWSDDKLTDTVYEHPTGPGFMHIPQGGQSGQVLIWDDDGQATWGTPQEMLVDVMEGSTPSKEGKSGLVPKPPAGLSESYLRNDGTWSIPPNTTYSEMIGATQDVDGVAGLVPKPSKSSSVTFLGSDGHWHLIDVEQAKPVWREYIPQ